MAAYRKISVTFWTDSFVQTLTPEGKYFYLYLMTNTKTTQCGIYEITIPQMCFETGYNSATIEKLLNQFQKTGKVKFSKETNEIALKNWVKYNFSDSPKVKACIAKELKLVKNKVLIEYLYSIDTSPQETKAKEETKEETITKAEAETIHEPSLNKSVYRSFNHLSLSEDEFKELTNLGYSKRQIDSILDSIQNYKNQANYTSLFLTAKTWLEKNPPKIKYPNLSKMVY